jgi:hypothetical protein
MDKLPVPIIFRVDLGTSVVLEDNDQRLGSCGMCTETRYATFSFLFCESFCKYG